MRQEAFDDEMLLSLKEQFGLWIVAQWRMSLMMTAGGGVGGLWITTYRFVYKGDWNVPLCAFLLVHQNIWNETLSK